MCPPPPREANAFFAAATAEVKAADNPPPIVTNQLVGIPLTADAAEFACDDALSFAFKLVLWELGTLSIAFVAEEHIFEILEYQEFEIIHML